MSRKAAQIVVDNAVEEIKKHTKWWFDDYMVGNILQEQGINLVSDTSMACVSPWRGRIHISKGFPQVPFIANKEGEYMIAQHYMNGKMDVLMNLFKL